MKKMKEKNNESSIMSEKVIYPKKPTPPPIADDELERRLKTLVNIINEKTQ